MIPKLSTPLAKLIRTLEGVIWLGANVALVVAPIVSSHASPADSIKWGAILNSVAFGSRQALKGLAIAKGFGAPAPAQLLSPEVLGKVENVAGTVAGDVAGDVSKGASAAKVFDQAAAAAPEAEQVLADIAASEAAAAKTQAAPGTAAEAVKAGLSPTAVADGQRPANTTTGAGPANTAA